MRKLMISEMISTDGFFSGPKGEIDWHNVDAEFNEYAAGMLDTLDTLLFGRTTYEMMASYWPSPDGMKDDPHIAERMNRLKKIVVSGTLKSVGWNNSEILQGRLEDSVSSLKMQPGKGIAVFGSGKLVSALAQAGLIDEYRLIVNPVVLGKGKTLFEGIKGRLRLELVQSREFKSGNVLLVYRQIK